MFARKGNGRILMALLGLVLVLTLVAGCSSQQPMKTAGMTAYPAAAPVASHTQSFSLGAGDSLGMALYSGGMSNAGPALASK